MRCKISFAIFLFFLQVQCKHDAPTGDVILDEALNHIKKGGTEEGVQVRIFQILKYIL